MSITPESVQALLESPELGDRLRAVNQIRQLDPAIGFELIQMVLDDRNPRVRYSGVSQLASLGQQDPAQTITLLRAGLQDSEPDVQAAAADSIGALKLTDAFDDLQQLYHRTNEWIVKFSIIAALGELGDDRAFGLLEEALQSGNELVQIVAIGSLGELGDDRAIRLLVPLVDTPDWQIRYRVAQALSRFNTPEARSALETLANDRNEQIAREAQSALS
ncbi:phycobilisome degradation protein NblB [Pantanalinema sp. GBBB05]|uniref:phycobilisome degradation protein NblB n=1 Tax=Pantanalinema sp. GBBB05 TaxID=2604139 RepID=UPI001D9C203C|nr:HEAT repeat domain-containing protein [Pantanalinema sp. GBBB05]